MVFLKGCVMPHLRKQAASKAASLNASKYYLPPLLCRIGLDILEYKVFMFLFCNNKIQMHIIFMLGIMVYQEIIGQYWIERIPMVSYTVLRSLIESYTVPWSPLVSAVVPWSPSLL